ncbi:MAG: SDR family NAD(P)-dependent oxidoreductase [Alphaproteobacteria bacterium]
MVLQQRGFKCQGQRAILRYGCLWRTPSQIRGREDKRGALDVMSRSKTATEQNGAVSLHSFNAKGVAVVFGSSGGIGSAFLAALEDAGHFERVIGFSRSGPNRFDLTDETSIERAVTAAADAGEIRLAIDATGFLHDKNGGPEKSLRDLDGQRLAHSFAINAIGPAMLMKHLLPRLPRSGKAAFCTLSARVGSIGDNTLGGWYGYRASKAALNQFVKTASIELARRSPEALCIALQPGTVATDLSAPFSGNSSTVLSPGKSAGNLLNVVNRLQADASGGFFDWNGAEVPW